MRGKNILLLSLIAMFMSTLLMNVGTAEPAATKLSITPTRIPDSALLGQPGDQYIMSVEIENVENLWSAGFEIHIAPYSSVLTASELFEGTFLSANGAWPTYMATSIDGLAGKVYVTLTRLPMPGWPPVPRQGAFGDGTLLTFKLTVTEAGDSPIALANSLLVDIDGNLIDHNTWDSAYYGTTAALVNVELPAGRKITAGDVFYINSKVRNDGNIPLNVTVRFSIRRTVDARTIAIRAGQVYGGGGLGEPLPFEYFYVDGYRENPLIGGHEWTNEGDAMVGEPDGNYIESTIANAWSMFYSFENLTLSGREIQNVDLFGYTSQPDGSTGWDFDPYVFPWGAWCDSMGGSIGWAWTGGRYYSGGPYDMPEYYIGPAMHNEAGFNNAEVMLQNYCPSGPRQQIDAMRWMVEFASITPVVYQTWEILPGEELDLPPITWPSTEDHVGDYEATATIEYTSEFIKWNSWASKQKTFAFRIVEP